MALINCSECGGAVSNKAIACPHCGYPIAPLELQSRPSPEEVQPIEKTGMESGNNKAIAFTGHPKMLRNEPGLFLLWVLLIPIGIGLVGLIIWWLSCLYTTLTVTNQRTILRKGILSKRNNELYHADVRNIRVNQDFVDRILGVGELQISSAGQSDIEIQVKGMLKPQKIADIIRAYRRKMA